MAKKREDGTAVQEYARSDVAKLVEVLRRDILDCEPDTCLGVEDVLVKRYRVSRPSLRQAVRVLEHEKLVAVRRGWAGGYYTRRPSDRDMAEAATLSLQVYQCSLEQAIFAGNALLRAIGKAASMSSDQAARDRLSAYVEEYEAFDTSRPVSDFINAEVTMAKRISELAQNPALNFFTDIVYEYGVRQMKLRPFDGRQDRMTAEIQITAKIARAICDGDTEIAEVLMARKDEMILGWINEDAPHTDTIS